MIYITFKAPALFKNMTSLTAPFSLVRGGRTLLSNMASSADSRARGRSGPRVGLPRNVYRVIMCGISICMVIRVLTV